MLLLDKEKECELEKYGFEKVANIIGGNYYNFGKSLTIYGSNYGLKNNLKIQISSNAKEMQDVLYDLIKNDVLIKVENPKKEKKKSDLELRIEELEKQMQELKETKNEN